MKFTLVFTLGMGMYLDNCVFFLNLRAACEPHGLNNLYSTLDIILAEIYREVSKLLIWVAPVL